MSSNSLSAPNSNSKQASKEWKISFWGEGNKGYSVLSERLGKGLDSIDEISSFYRNLSQINSECSQKLQKLAQKTFTADQATLAQALKGLNEFATEISSCYEDVAVKVNETLAEKMNMLVDEYKALRSKHDHHMEKAGKDLQHQQKRTDKAKSEYVRSCQSLQTAINIVNKGQTAQMSKKEFSQVQQRAIEGKKVVDFTEAGFKAELDQLSKQQTEWENQISVAAADFQKIEEKRITLTKDLLSYLADIQEQVLISRQKEAFANLRMQISNINSENDLEFYRSSLSTGTKRASRYQFVNYFTSADSDKQSAISNESTGLLDKLKSKLTGKPSVPAPVEVVVTRRESISTKSSRATSPAVASVQVNHLEATKDKEKLPLNSHGDQNEKDTFSAPAPSLQPNGVVVKAVDTKLPTSNSFVNRRPAIPTRGEQDDGVRTEEITTTPENTLNNETTVKTIELSSNPPVSPKSPAEGMEENIPAPHNTVKDETSQTPINPNQDSVTDPSSTENPGKNEERPDSEIQRRSFMDFYLQQTQVQEGRSPLPDKKAGSSLRNEANTIRETSEPTEKDNAQPISILRTETNHTNELNLHDFTIIALYQQPESPITGPAVQESKPTGAFLQQPRNNSTNEETKDASNDPLSQLKQQQSFVHRNSSSSETANQNPPRSFSQQRLNSESNLKEEQVSTRPPSSLISTDEKKATRKAVKREGLLEILDDFHRDDASEPLHWQSLWCFVEGSFIWIFDSQEEANRPQGTTKPKAMISINRSELLKGDAAITDSMKIEGRNKDFMFAIVSNKSKRRTVFNCYNLENFEGWTEAISKSATKKTAKTAPTQ